MYVEWHLLHKMVCTQNHAPETFHPPPQSLRASVCDAVYTNTSTSERFTASRPNTMRNNYTNLNKRPLFRRACDTTASAAASSPVYSTLWVPLPHRHHRRRRCRPSRRSSVLALSFISTTLPTQHKTRMPHKTHRTHTNTQH